MQRPVQSCTPSPVKGKVSSLNASTGWRGLGWRAAYSGGSLYRRSSYTWVPAGAASRRHHPAAPGGQEDQRDDQRDDPGDHQDQADELDVDIGGRPADGETKDRADHDERDAAADGHGHYLLSRPAGHARSPAVRGRPGVSPVCFPRKRNAHLPTATSHPRFPSPPQAPTAQPRPKPAAQPRRPALPRSPAQARRPALPPSAAAQRCRQRCRPALPPSAAAQPCPSPPPSPGPSPRPATPKPPPASAAPSPTTQPAPSPHRAATPKPPRTLAPQRHPKPQPRDSSRVRCGRCPFYPGSRAPSP